MRSHVVQEVRETRCCRLSARQWVPLFNLSRLTSLTHSLSLSVHLKSYRSLTELEVRIDYMMESTRLALSKKRTSTTESSQVPKKPNVDEAAEELVALTSGTTVQPVKRPWFRTLAKRLVHTGAVIGVPTPEVKTSGEKRCRRSFAPHRGQPYRLGPVCCASSDSGLVEERRNC